MSSEVLVWLKPVPQEVHFEIKRNSTDMHISAFIIAFCLLIFMQKATLLMSFSAYLERHGLYLIHLEMGICVCPHRVLILRAFPTGHQIIFF